MSGSGDSNGFVVVSVVENRSREICICKMDAGNMSQLDIYLLADTHGYAESLATLAEIAPNEVLLHDGCKQRVLTAKVMSLMNARLDAVTTTQGGNVQPTAATAPQSRSHNHTQHVSFISRQYFDQDRGADLLDKLTVGKVNSELVGKYTVLAGAYCLLRFMENYTGSSFAPRTMRIVYCTTCVSKMFIDRHTVTNLELLHGNSNTVGSSSAAFMGGRGAKEDDNSLFGAIDRTKTTVGSRLLRANLLAPSADLTTIEMRLDVVEHLLRQPPHLLLALGKALKQLPDIDKVLGGVVAVPKGIVEAAVNTTSSGTGAGTGVGCVISPTATAATTKHAKTTIDTCITMKQVLLVASKVAQLLDDINHSNHGNNSASSSNELLTVLCGNLTQESVFQDVIMAAIDTHLTPSTTYSRSAAEMRHQECFAIKAGVNGLLDVARKTYLQSVEDIYELANQYTAAINQQGPGSATTAQVSTEPVNVKVGYSASRGYFLTVPSTINPLPQAFIQGVLNRRTIACTTVEVMSLSDRAQEAISQALVTTHTLLQRDLLVSKIRTHMNELFALADSIALVDMLLSFATMVHDQNTQQKPAGTGARAGPGIDSHHRQQPQTEGAYTRPAVRQGGPLVIRAGSHPIVINSKFSRGTAASAQSIDGISSSNSGNNSTEPEHHLQAPRAGNTRSGTSPLNNSGFQPNDTFMNPLSSMHVVTGCNGSGKTVYIKQVALIVILAQIGCYVPAASGTTIPIRDRILSRLGTSDDLEHNLSSFMVEMRECAYICDNITPSSLVLLDEVGRGTSNVDGISLAFAIAEHLLLSHPTAYTLFVTHFPQITSLPSLYCNVRNMHLSTIVNSVGTNGLNTDDIPATQSAAGAVTDMHHRQHPQQQRPCDRMQYTHVLCEGPCDVQSGYGLLIAELCGFPASIMKNAYQLYAVVQRVFPMLLRCGEASGVRQGQCLALTNDTSSAACQQGGEGTKVSQSELHDLLQKLLLLSESTLDDSSIRRYLQAIHDATFGRNDEGGREELLALVREHSRTRSVEGVSAVSEPVSLTRPLVSPDAVEVDTAAKRARLHQSPNTTLEPESNAMLMASVAASPRSGAASTADASNNSKCESSTLAIDQIVLTPP